ncbi:CAP domain-containing protein [Mycobacterium sp. SMC-8]|uniref:CAP domain-containing protein n=1 Tax=Mycobacterium sp. SMC-8 TaxID=2857060 RepID=UPI0021B2D84F|nr:CAP domain-containing protein [Mycobacterium sp. SMC-8]UXA11537.1 CAP domain-containing protein [Mycobacterium sp. SMC-8]
MADIGVRSGVIGGPAIALLSACLAVTVVNSPTAQADNRRLNESVVVNVDTIQQQHGCKTGIRIDPKLRLAAQWHANDVLNNRALNGDIGSDGSTTQERVANAGFQGIGATTVAINPALAISGIEIIRQWYFRPDYMAIISNCAFTRIGVWSENRVDRSVVVAVYGQPA